MVDPLRHPDFFDVRRMFTVSDLFEARVHLGHKMGQLDKYMAEYLIGERHGVCVFDLDRTAQLLRSALNFTAHMASRSGIVLFVCKYGQHTRLVETTARECGEYAHCHEWINGTLTDAWRLFGGLMRAPDLIILLNTRETAIDMHQVVFDAAKMCIPLVGVVDSNADPRLVTYPVPGNDDSPTAIALYCRLFAEAIRRGKAVASASKQMQDSQELTQDSQESTQDSEESEPGFGDGDEKL